MNLIISCKFFPLNDFVTVFPIQPDTILGDQILTCHKLGHGQPKVIIYIYFAGQVSRSYDSVLENKILKVFTMYEHGGHLGNSNKLLFLLLKKAPHKMWL